MFFQVNWLNFKCFHWRSFWFLDFILDSCRVVGTEERIPIPLMDYILNVVSVDSFCFVWVCWEMFHAIKQCPPQPSPSLISLQFTCFSDEVCGIYTEQQHHRRPLSGVCHPEGAATSGFYSGPAQLAHRLPHFCCLPSCGWCLQVHIGEHKRKSLWWYLFLFLLKCQI